MTDHHNREAASRAARRRRHQQAVVQREIRRLASGHDRDADRPRRPSPPRATDRPGQADNADFVPPPPEDSSATSLRRRDTSGDAASQPAGGFGGALPQTARERSTAPNDQTLDLGAIGLIISGASPSASTEPQVARGQRPGQESYPRYARKSATATAGATPVKAAG